MMKLFKVKMHTQILIAIVLGIVTGIVLGPHSSILSPIAEMFVRSLRMIIVPLVFSSLVMGIVNLGSLKNLETMGIRSLVYFLYYDLTCRYYRSYFSSIISAWYWKPGASLTSGFTT